MATAAEESLTMQIRPVIFKWDGDHMVPHPRFASLCNRQFVVEELYTLGVVDRRSTATHNHFFACVGDAWSNLNEHDSKRFPHPDHLRKWALIHVGHCTQTDYPMDTPADARKMAAAVRKADEYAVITIPKDPENDRGGTVVKVFAAKSIARAAVPDNKAFQAIKTAVLDLIAGMANTTRVELEKHAGKSA